MSCGYYDKLFISAANWLINDVEVVSVVALVNHVIVILNLHIIKQRSHYTQTETPIKCQLNIHANYLNI